MWKLLLKWPLEVSVVMGVAQPAHVMLAQFAENPRKPMPLGMHAATKTDEFSEKFQTAFNPPPSFSENDIADFLGTHRLCASNISPI